MEGDVSERSDGEFSTEVDESSRASEVIIGALAEMADESASELDVTLYDHIDPDALNDLFRSTGDGEMSVTFRLDSHAVTLRKDGNFHVCITDSENVNLP